MAGKEAGCNAQVVVVGRSKVNCVVISRIIESMGLRAICEQPGTAASALARHVPKVVILDTSAADGDWNDMLSALSKADSNTTCGSPGVIALVTDKNSGPPARVVADIVVAKPVTQDRLQPAIESLMARHG